MLAVESYENNEVRSVKYGHETGLHGNTMRVFDAGCKAVDVHVVFSDFPRKIRQIGERCHDANLGRIYGQRPRCQSGENHNNDFELK